MFLTPVEQLGKKETGIVSSPKKVCPIALTLLHSERSKLYTILAFLSAIRLSKGNICIAKETNKVREKYVFAKGDYLSASLAK